MPKNSKEQRPKLKIESAPIDKVTELIGILGLIILIGLPIYFYDQLPEKIPSHYGVGGEPDSFSGKSFIWSLPVVGSILFVGMFWINKFPHTFNYSQPITMENARRLYTVGTRIIRTLSAIIACVFAYITYSTIQTALGRQFGLGSWFTPIFITLIFGSLGYFLYKSSSDAARK